MNNTATRMIRSEEIIIDSRGFFFYTIPETT